MTDPLSPALAAWLQRFAARASSEEMIERFVAHVDDDILEQIPQIADDPILAEDLHRSTRGHWRSFLVALGQDHRLMLPEQAADLARSLARRDLDLGVLLKVYRVAAQSVFRYFTEATEDLGPDAPPRDEVLVHIWPRADLWIAESTEELIETYVAERERRLEGALQRRASVIRAVLDGTVDSADEASRGLTHPANHWQTALVMWTTASAAGAGESMMGVARRAATLLGAPPPLTLLVGSRDLWCWLATPTRPDLDPLDRLEPDLVDRDVRIAVGLPAPGLAGFRSGHQEALAAQRLVAGGAAVPRLVGYDQVELLCLAEGNDELLHRMVRREVAPLCGAEKNLGLIRQTVLSYLSHRMNVETTAEELFVHKNTVRYRIARAEELLGHSLAEQATLIELGLRYVAVFGAPPEE